MSKVKLNDPTSKSTDRAQIFAVPSFAGDSSSVGHTPAASPIEPARKSMPNAASVRGLTQALRAKNSTTAPLQMNRSDAAIAPASNHSFTSPVISNSSRVVNQHGMIRGTGTRASRPLSPRSPSSAAEVSSNQPSTGRIKGQLVLSGEMASLDNATAIAIVQQLANQWAVQSCAAPVQNHKMWRMSCQNHEAFFVWFSAGSILVDFEAEGFSTEDETQFRKRVDEALSGDVSWGGMKLISATLNGTNVRQQNNNLSDFDRTMQSAAVGLLVVCMLVGLIGLFISFYRQAYQI
jgi:hypothetical protein